MVQIERMAENFKRLVEIDSISKDEKKVCAYLVNQLKSLGAQVEVDRAGENVGGNSGNIIAFISGDRRCAPILLSAHMDTVEPGRGIKVVRKGDNLSSGGDTILGADDKSAVAILLEVLTVLKENQLSHGPLEIVLTICEEVGLLGAKHLDYHKLKADFGYVLDSRDVDGIVTQAPSANRLEIIIAGKAAHAGAEPEKGINAIVVAGRAIADLKIGRIDSETTCNLGLIAGGIATNIVPNQCIIQGEVRSHDPEKLDQVTETIRIHFQKSVEEYRKKGIDKDLPSLEFKVEKDFERLHIPPDHPSVMLARKAASSLGRALIVKTSGGGSDANVFFQHGIITGVLGTGMQAVHTLSENINLQDMYNSSELLLKIVQMHGAEENCPLLQTSRGLV